MPRPKPLTALHGQVDFSKLPPFDPAVPLSVNDFLVMRREAGGPNLIARVGDVQAHTGGAVDISDLLGGSDDDMLYRVAGVWTGTGGVGLTFDGSLMNFAGSLGIQLEDGNFVIDGDGDIELDGGQIKAADGSAALPSISFAGDTASGFYSDNVSVFASIGGTDRFNFTGQFFQSTNAGGPRLRNAAASTILPTVLPNQTDIDTGIGWRSANIMTFIAEGAGILDIKGVPGARQVIAIPTIPIQDTPATPVIQIGSNAHGFYPSAAAVISGAISGVEVMEMVGAASGGLRANNTVTGAGMERVLTESDASSVFPLFQFPALQLENPNSADWTVNALAPAIADSNNAGLTVRAFDDTIEEGVGFTIKMPANSDGGPGPTTTDIVFTAHARAETAPPGDRDLRFKFYHRTLPDNLVVTPWDSGVTFVNVTFPANEFFQEFVFTISFFAFGLEPDELVQFEMTRVQPQGGNANLPGDMILAELEVSFA